VVRCVAVSPILISPTLIRRNRSRALLTERVLSRFPHRRSPPCSCGHRHPALVLVNRHNLPVLPTFFSYPWVYHTSGSISGNHRRAPDIFVFFPLLVHPDLTTFLSCYPGTIQIWFNHFFPKPFGVYKINLIYPGTCGSFVRLAPSLPYSGSNGTGAGGRIWFYQTNRIANCRTRRKGYEKESRFQ